MVLLCRWDPTIARASINRSGWCCFAGGMKTHSHTRIVYRETSTAETHLPPDFRGRALFPVRAVTNMRGDVEYKFNIVNLVKPDSLYNIGMRPAFFSAIDNVKGKSSWRRTGERISYFENQYETEGGQPYYTLTFTVTFPNAKDVCYIAHCFPYGYSDLSACLNDALSRAGSNKHIQMSTLCSTLAGNKCPSLTITNFTSPPSAIQARYSTRISLHEI